ncbi:VOC family protein [Nonomuraea polychroma]|uniref:VOC family protein n=1 Tax=Nonomuraea polychroma TaxID=46176 RepID=UPI0019D49312
MVATPDPVHWRGVHHLALVTADMDATVRFWHGVLGARARERQLEIERRFGLETVVGYDPRRLAAHGRSGDGQSRRHLHVRRPQEGGHPPRRREPLAAGGRGDPASPSRRARMRGDRGALPRTSTARVAKHLLPDGHSPKEHDLG